MNKTQLLTAIQNTPETIQFNDVISVIDNNYTFIPSQFINGELVNAPDENNGSCKIFAFAKLNNLNQSQTLHCFGDYYRNDVLNHPNDNNHQNIRNFITIGWSGIRFENYPLQIK